jgi:hypothetical protein
VNPHKHSTLLDFRLLALFGVLIPALLLSQPALALGGTGCGSLEGSPLGKAAREGNRAQFDRAIQDMVADDERSLGRPVVIKLSMQSRGLEKWRLDRTRSILNGNHPPRTACGWGPLLPLAVNAGNLEVVRYLLNHPVGVDPIAAEYVKGRLHRTMFMTCRYDSTMDDDRRQRRLQAFAMALESNKSALNTISDDGYTALKGCNEPEIVSLYLSYGADPTLGLRPNEPNLLEVAIRDAIGFQPGSYTDQSRHGLSRVRLWAQHGMKSIVGRPSEREIEFTCNDGWGLGWHMDTCRTLATFIEASPGVFGRDTNPTKSARDKN